MNRYKVNRMWIEKRSGEVLLEDQFSFDDTLIAGLRPFSSEITAFAYCRKAAHDWITAALAKWISHKENIYKNISVPVPQHEAVKKLKEAAQAYQEAKLSKVCNSILRGKAIFEACLPPQSNPSYASSLKNLQEIFEFCQETKDTNYANL